MKIGHLIHIGLLVVLTFPSSGVAQPSSGKPQKSPDVVRLETEMLEARYSVKQTEETRKALITNYETLIPFSCVATQEKAEYLSDGCALLLNKTLELDPKNDRATCYKEGFSSPRCKELSQNKANATAKSPSEQLRELLEAPPQQLRSKPQDALDPERQRIKIVSDQLLKTSLDYKRTGSPQKKGELLRLYSQLLPLVCKMKQGQVYDPGPECMSHTEQSLMVDPTFTIGLCFRDGPTSPYCRGVPNKQAPQRQQNQSDKGFIEF